ncbi:hypothetical protein L596_006275 [Steinernema carpocapsae]|uniref:Uncharacterized protein n=1 Tax=Steinernema carpocapsae TaxID=34508 RepID=A0A4U8V1U1_STECR|nr:hypothetical protein L596_006275 [Steinernema carpocapsae]
MSSNQSAKMSGSTKLGSDQTCSGTQADLPTSSGLSTPKKPTVKHNFEELLGQTQFRRPTLAHMERTKQAIELNKIKNKELKQQKIKCLQRIDELERQQRQVREAQARERRFLQKTLDEATSIRKEIEAEIESKKAETSTKKNAKVSK